MNTIEHDALDFEEYFDQQQVDSAKVKRASQWVDAVVDRFHGKTTEASWTPMGFNKAAGKFDIRPGEVTIWAGINSHGKTTFLSHVMLNVMQGKATACLASLEMPPAVSMAKMVRQASGIERPSEAYIRSFHRWTDDRLWIYDHVGKVEPKRMLAIATYVRKELKIDHLVIDSLMKCGIGTDDYTAQKDFVDGLCTIAKDTGLHVHLVCHMRKGESERKAPEKFDVKGAGEITDLVDNLVIVWKNQRKHEEMQEAERESDEAHRNGLLTQLRLKPDAYVRVAKQRATGWEGALTFWFDKASEQFTEAPFSRPNWIDTGEDLNAVEKVEDEPFVFPDVEAWELPPPSRAPARAFAEGGRHA